MESESSKYEDCQSKLNRNNSLYQDTQSKINIRKNSSNKFKSSSSIYEDARSIINQSKNASQNFDNYKNESNKNINTDNITLNFKNKKNGCNAGNNSKYNDNVATTQDFYGEIKDSNEETYKTEVENEEIKGGCCNDPKCFIF